ncbi:N-acetylmuramoyl-L-alanine amidase [Liparis tanakae]|uniref:N-acetylmuramoyl-L-alanine amidase n=1 Tax=Liparis tanakae TaxID=230148 RepID=A0A4Z2J0H5_9TELE|nr:N-acetylmuramoyl-L-alanine amidase [Liparis tanakae]
MGSDGYVYEGRGWKHLGTHTRGHNAIGYGVSIIGNYTAALPSRHTLDLLRHRLVRCAVEGGWLVANFTIQGHRQAATYTSCPGDALFSEIRGIAAYNMGDGNVRSIENMDVGSTGGDYSHDVSARAQWYQSQGGF